MAIPVLRRTDGDVLVGVQCRCGAILAASSESGLAAQLAVHWRTDDWAVDLPSSSDLEVARRFVASHAFELDDDELDLSGPTAG
jgi:hypothetical protein